MHGYKPKLDKPSLRGRNGHVHVKPMLAHVLHTYPECRGFTPTLFSPEPVAPEIACVSPKTDAMPQNVPPNCY